MEVLEAGHIYRLEVYGMKDGEVGDLRIQFENKEPGTEHPGTRTQEVLRALIDRTTHCYHCLPDPLTAQIIHHMRMALVLHESRALYRKVEKGELQPEGVDTWKDGHFRLPPGHLQNVALQNVALPIFTQDPHPRKCTYE